MKRFKQAILLRKDLEMSTGKLIAQGSHASLESYQQSDSEERNSWVDQGQKKIVLEASKEELKNKIQKAEEMNLTYFKVKDAGHTEVKPGTITALGIGPADEKKLDRITGDLPLLK